jgi:thiol-disulfide isomerase/thioredoxin
MFSKVSLKVFCMVGFLNNCYAQDSIADVQRYVKENSHSLVLFYRPSCPYSRYVLPLFDQVKTEHKGINFLKVNIDANASEFKAAFQFSTVPTFIYFSNSKEQFRHGSNNKKLQLSEIKSNIEKYILN